MIETARMLVNVQFLRFIAATLVVLYHTSSHVRDAGIQQGALFSLSEAVGFAGVDVFFVISGFIMAYTTGASTGIKAGWAFVRRRLARIYSGYWPFFLLAFALFAWVNPEQLQTASLARSAVLWPTNNLLITVSWTLIFEMSFYVLYTLLILFTPAQRGRLLQTILGCIIVWSTYSQFGRHAYDPGHLEYMSLAEYYTVSPYLVEFLAGAIAAERLRVPSGRHGLPWLVSGCLAFVLAGWVNNHLFAGEIEQGYHVFYRVLLFGTPALLILTGLMGLEHIGRTAPVKFSMLTGGASYAIYLSHTLLLSVSQHLGFNSFAGGLGTMPARLLFCALILIILSYSTAHYWFLERHLHSFFKRVTALS